MRTLSLANNLTFVFDALPDVFWSLFIAPPTENQNANKKNFSPDTSGAVNTFFVEILSLFFPPKLYEPDFVELFTHPHIHTSKYIEIVEVSRLPNRLEALAMAHYRFGNDFCSLQWQKICRNIIVSIISEYLAYFVEFIVNFCHFCTAKFHNFIS